MTVVKQKPSIQNTILFSLIIIAVFSTGIYSFMWIYQEYSQFKNESAVVRDEFLNSNKARVKNEVERAVKYVEYKRSQTETRLKESIKTRVYEAYNIATNIYNKNHGRKSDDEIKKMIMEALQSIIFNNGRGYFFVTNFDGISELFADHPELEGTSMMNVKDTNGQFVIQDLIQIAKDSGEGFYRYTWTKPNVEGKDFPKIAFIKHFAPYDWFIGTGEYLDDTENDIMQEIIQWLETIRFGNNDILFAGTWEGFSVFGGRKNKHRKRSLYNITDINGKKFIQELIFNAKKGGGFTSYTLGKEYDQRRKVKISYSTAINDWQWYIGAGFFATDIDALIEKKRTELKQNIKNFIITEIHKFRRFFPGE